MVESNERRLSFSSLNPQLILHRHSSASMSDHHLSGISTPPLQTAASVPFKWEQEPGKPRAVSQFGPKTEPEKSLDPPPPFRAMQQQIIMNKEYSAPKIASRSILDDGPYKIGRPMFSSSRFARDGPDPFESYDVTQFDQPFGSSKINKGGGSGRRSSRGLLAKFKGGGKSQRDHQGHGHGGISGLSFSSNSSCDSDIVVIDQNHNSDGNAARITRLASFSSSSHHHHNKPSSHIWASIYGGFKQVVQWKSSSKRK